MTDDATKMKQERDLALAECRRLKDALAIANSNHEEFERKWYLSQDICERLCSALDCFIAHGTCFTSDEFQQAKETLDAARANP